jgi:hypothetical protein
MGKTAFGPLFRLSDLDQEQEHVQEQEQGAGQIDCNFFQDRGSVLVSK